MISSRDTSRGKSNDTDKTESRLTTNCNNNSFVSYQDDTNTTLRSAIGSNNTVYGENWQISQIKAGVILSTNGHRKN